MEHVIRFLELLADKKRLFLFIQLVFCIPISTILYINMVSEFEIDNITMKRAIEFIMKGQFIIPFLFYSCALIISFKIVPFFIKIITKVFLKKTASWLFYLISFLKKDQTKVFKNFAKKCFSEKKNYTMLEISNVILGCNNVIIIIMQFFCTYIFYIKSRYSFSTQVEALLILLLSLILIHVLILKITFQILVKYPNQFSFIMNTKINEPNTAIREIPE